MKSGVILKDAHCNQAVEQFLGSSPCLNVGDSLGVCRLIEGCAAIDLDGGLSALGYQLSAISQNSWGPFAAQGSIIRSNSAT
jgi:hypothetical protein